MAVFSYTPVADLLVELIDPQGQHSLFLVASGNLRVASPVWRKSLDPESKFAPLGTMEVNGIEYKKITVQDIEAQALKIILDIIHYQTKDIPTNFASFNLLTEVPQMSFQILRSIALLVDQYDCAELLLPWAKGWCGSGLISGMKWPNSFDPDYNRVGHEDWIFIASALVNSRLGRFYADPITEYISRNLIKSLITRKNDQGTGFNYYRWMPIPEKSALDPVTSESTTIRNPERGGYMYQVDLELVPQRIIDFVLNEKHIHMQKILKPLYEFVQRMVKCNFEGQEAQSCRNPDCCAIALGSLVQSLNEQNLGDLLREDFSWEQEFGSQYPEIHSSLEMMVLRIKDLRITTFDRTIHKTASENAIDSDIHAAFARKVRTPVASVVIIDSIFLRNDPENTTMPSICPLAFSLLEIKQKAQAVLDSIVGYKP